MRTRPRTKFVKQLKARRCSKCGTLLHRQTVRCKKCSQMSVRPKK